MATVGDQLLQPEAGWRRYNGQIGSITFSGNWLIANHASYHNSDNIYSTDINAKISFRFIGTKLRIIGLRDIARGNVYIKIDGIKEIYNQNGASQFQTLVYEKTGLPEIKHEVEIGFESASLDLDAIDIDSTGGLLPIPPATTGKLCNTLGEMDIGDYIVWKRDGNTHSFGGSIDGYTEISTTGVVSSSLPTKHFHYAIKVDTGLLISDRVTEHTIIWDTLNSQKRIQGLPIAISGVSGAIRSLTGGVAYADEIGNMSLTNLNKGCFPTNNEWDKYIINFPTSKIQSGKSLDDVWHYLDMYTLTQDTASNGIYISSSGTSSATVNSTFRTMRGKSGIWGDFGIRQSGNSGTDGGFRPVFEWKEV
ncbi:hypothetical protein ABE099_08765 [Paenibacillus turicensis]|uniref:hypothetical protein n=1 Tax=Paenibacillus turicensis TaxID=160487 RepID=UPI003D2E5E71